MDFNKLYMMCKNEKPKNYIKTNIKVLDDILDGGLLEGRITEVVGLPDSGKTKLMFDMVENIEDDKIILYIFTNSNSVYYLDKRNLSTKENLVVCFSNKETEIMTIIKNLYSEVDVIIIDSIAEILTNKEEKNDSALQDMEGLLKQLNNFVYNKRKSIVVVNHISMYNNRNNSKWNNKFKKYCSVRIRIDNEDDTKIIKVVDNKLNPRIIDNKDIYVY